MSQSVPKIFILEGPSPLDLLKDRGERSSLEQVCRQFGHQVASFLVLDKVILRRTLDYVASISRCQEEVTDPVFIHISVHGNSSGIVVGHDDLSWDDLSELVVRMYSDLDNYGGPVILILSACGGSQQKLTKLLKAKVDKDEVAVPPKYIFVFTKKKIKWKDAVVAWTIFYSQIGSINFFSEGGRDEIRRLLKRLHRSALARLTYYRWDDEKNDYLRWHANRKTN